MSLLLVDGWQLKKGTVRFVQGGKQNFAIQTFEEILLLARHFTKIWQMGQI
jgi:hypothetical protein